MGGLQMVFLIASLGTATAQINKIWSLAIGHDYGAHEYIDTDGNMRGFGYDILEAVCKEGRMDCRMVWDKYIHCWQADPNVHSSVGRGLLARWFDGCMGWVTTIERIHSLSFTHPYTGTISSYFFFLKNKNFNSRDLGGKTIILLEGWASDDKCIARQTNIRNNKVPAYKLHIVPNPADAIVALKDGMGDAVFGSIDNWQAEQQELLEKEITTYSCFLSGNTVISRKDSAFTAAFNVGFSKLKDSNRYQKICNDFSKNHEHKGPMNCNF